MESLLFLLRSRVAWAFCLLVLSPVAGHAGAYPPSAVATIFPVGDLMRRLAGPAVAVSVLLPAGATPHSFELTPAQAKVIADADLFVSIGGGFDSWAERFAPRGKAPKLSLVEATGASGRGRNPHIWLDPVLVRVQIVPLLARALSEIAPGQARAIAVRREKLTSALADLDNEIRSSLEGVRKRSFVAFHPAWDLFAHRYGLKGVAVLGTSDRAEPSPAHVVEVIRAGKREALGALLVEAQVRSGLASAIAAEFGAVTIMVDPLGGWGLPGRDSYVALMRFNLRAFVRALR